MDRICDLRLYPKVVPHVKKVDIYESTTLPNVSHFEFLFMIVKAFSLRRVQ
jgi:hypothetical protein